VRGLQACIVACPGGGTVEPEAEKAVKCDLCKIAWTRIEARLRHGLHHPMLMLKRSKSPAQRGPR